MEIKVGDRIEHKGNAVYGRCEILLITAEHVVVNVNRANDGRVVLAIWKSCDIIPPPPTVLFEGWFNHYPNWYDANQCFIWQSEGDAKRSLDGFTRGGPKRVVGAQALHIWHLSDGTWHIKAAD